jgi:hypothetical protein
MIRKVTLVGIALGNTELTHEERISLAKAYARKVHAAAVAGRLLESDDVVEVAYIEEETVARECCCGKGTEELNGGCNE